MDATNTDATNMDTLTTAIPQSPSLAGRVLEGRWEVIRKLGEGAMGTVYLASQRSVDRTVALKTLRPELADSPEFVQRFLREAQVASALAHPHCVTLHDFGQTADGVLYLVMEYLQGQTLADRLHAGALPLAEVLEICMQIASALSAAHQQHIIHRDLKPENIFLLQMPDHSVFIKVLDFGIAKLMGAGPQMTNAGEVHGTPLFMSPEQCRGLALDGRSDLYSLGCILYYMLTGQLLFYADNPLTVMLSHINEPVPPVSRVATRQDIPPELMNLCMELLRKAPAERPASAPIVRQRLKALLDQFTSGPNPRVETPPRLHASQPAPALAGTAAITATTDPFDALPPLQTPAALTPDADFAAQSLGAPVYNPATKWWMLSLVLVGLIIATGTLAAIGTWLLDGSPDLLPAAPVVAGE